MSLNSLVSRKNVSIVEKMLLYFHTNNTAAAVYMVPCLCVYSQAGALQLKQVPELQNQNIHKNIERQNYKSGIELCQAQCKLTIVDISIT